MATNRDAFGPLAGPGAEPAGGATPSKLAFPIGSYTLSGDWYPTADGTWRRPNAIIPDGASVAETDLLLRRAAMKQMGGEAKLTKGAPVDYM